MSQATARASELQYFAEMRMLPYRFIVGSPAYRVASGEASGFLLEAILSDLHALRVQSGRYNEYSKIRACYCGWPDFA
jgi:hypothetical protein